MPSTCHSFKFRYSLIASAARKDRLRPVLLASFSSRFLITGSIRTLTVVEAMSCLCRLCLIVYILAREGDGRQHEGPASLQIQLLAGCGLTGSALRAEPRSPR